MAEPLRVGLVGAGFWASYQAAAWGELEGVRCVAVCDQDRPKAESLAKERGIKKVYADAAELLKKEKPDVLDIITNAATHAPLVRLAVEKKTPVICQKPMSASASECEELVGLCSSKKVPFSIHENWRWQAPLRRVKELLAAGAIGTPLRCRIDMITAYDVFANQPGLRDEARFILADMGCHLFDLARSWFGEAESLHCLTRRVHADIKGEDLATALIAMGGVAVTVNLSYAGTPVERDCFPETLAFIEGEKGSIELVPGCRLRVTTAKGTEELQVPPTPYAWMNPKYAVVQSSMVPCLKDLLRALKTGSRAETDAADNLQTMRLVFAAYRSATMGQAIQL
ncbi:MAG TPA: Gfo/Idh/MocA family oxidoreductase [Planctomycetota bacterium]|nr:Gfo/Idh/MocA family oxidoreductase [Planctomycetota bacterium]